MTDVQHMAVTDTPENDGIQTFGYATDEAAFNMPSAYASSLEAIGPGVTSLVDEQQGNGENWFDTLGRLLPGLVATYQQKQLLQLQVDRARQGLPPLNASQYGAGINVGLSQDTQKLIMYGGIALVAFMLLSKR